MKFSTLDNDNDQNSNDNCAVVYGGWWYNNDCANFRINYRPPYLLGYNLLFTEIKIRPKDCIKQ